MHEHQPTLHDHCPVLHDHWSALHNHWHVLHDHWPMLDYHWPAPHRTTMTTDWHVLNRMNWICRFWEIWQKIFKAINTTHYTRSIIIIIIIIIINIIIIIINKHIFIVLYPKRESLDFVFVFFPGCFLNFGDFLKKTFTRSPVFEKENTAAWNLHITVRLPWVSSFHQFSFHSHFKLTFWFWMMYL